MVAVGIVFGSTRECEGAMRGNVVDAKKPSIAVRCYNYHHTDNTVMSIRSSTLTTNSAPRAIRASMYHLAQHYDPQHQCCNHHYHHCNLHYQNSYSSSSHSPSPSLSQARTAPPNRISQSQHRNHHHQHRRQFQFVIITSLYHHIHHT